MPACYSLPQFPSMCGETWSSDVKALLEIAERMDYVAFYDVFKGEAHMSAEARHMCWPVASFDIEADAIHENCFLKQGQDRFITDVLRMRPLSLAMLGPPCKYSIWMTRSVHGKSKQNPLGNGSQFAEEGNKIAVFCGNGVRLIAWRRCLYVLEQPLSSVLTEHPSLKAALEETGGVRLFMRQGWTGAFSDKPTALWTNAPYASRLRKLFEQKLFTSNVCQSLATKSKWVTGNTFMTKSASYPIEFCYLLCATHEKWTTNLKKEFFVILKLAIWPLLRSKTHVFITNPYEPWGEIALMLYTMLMV